MSAAWRLPQIPGDGPAAPHAVSLSGLETQLEVNLDPAGLQAKRENVWLQTGQLSQLSREPQVRTLTPICLPPAVADSEQQVKGLGAAHLSR